jgi:L-glyceraldehyde 3-phosphate reductase
LNDLAAARGQTLAQMAIAWVLRDERVTSALIGASSVEQLEDNIAAVDRLGFTDAELAEIDRYAIDGAINIWAPRASTSCARAGPPTSGFDCRTLSRVLGRAR